MAASHGQVSQSNESQAYLVYLSLARNAFIGTSKTSDNIYTPRSVLLKYFTDDYSSLDRLLKAVLKEEQDTLPASETILQHYLATFTILLSLGKGRYLNRFIERGYNDERLPYFECPRFFPDSASFFGAFVDAQWRYCPVRFPKDPVNLQIEPEQILPVKRLDQISNDGTAVIHRVEIHADYDPFNNANVASQLSTSKVSFKVREIGLSNGDKPSSHRYLFKEFRGTSSKASYDEELSVFLHLQKHSQLLGRTVVGFYGSFVHKDTFIMILEDADLGTLEDFFNNTGPPGNGEDVTRLWEDLLGLHEALHVIHNISGPYPPNVKSQSLLGGWHQNVNPLSIAATTGKGNGFRILDLGANVAGSSYKNYAAPELVRVTSIEHLNMQMTDVWSLGCVYSEFAVWSTLGVQGLKEYRAAREAECQSVSMQNMAAFHDGRDVLQCVRTYHDEAVANRSSDDKVTDPIVQQLIEEMLCEDSDARPSTRQLKMKINKILARAREQHAAVPRRNDSAASSGSGYSSLGLSPRGHLSYSPSVKSGGSADSIPTRSIPDRSRGTSTSRSTVRQGESLASSQMVGGDKETSFDYPHSRPFSPISALGQFRPPPVYRTLSANGSIQELDSGDVNVYAPPRVVSQGFQFSSALLRGEDKEVAVTRERPSAQPNHPLPTPMTTLIRETPTVYTPIEIRPDNDPRMSAITQKQHTLSAAVNLDPNLRRTLPSPNSEAADNPSRKSADLRCFPSSPSGHQIPSSSEVSTSAQRIPSGSSVQIYKPYLSLIDGLKWLDQRKGAASSATLRDEGYLNNLAHRDCIFLVDDSASMRAHREMTSRAIRFLSWLLKKYDQNGMDLYFMQSRERTHARPDHSSDLQRPLLKQLDVCKGIGDPVPRLTEIVQDYRDRNTASTGATPVRSSRSGSFANIGSSNRTPTGFKKITIYVITDGNWQAGTEVKLEKNLHVLGTTLRSQGAPEKAVGIQFIYTERRKEVISRLRASKAKDYSNRISLDDEYLEGNVFRLLLGSISDIWVGDDDDEEEVPVPQQVRSAQDVANARRSVSEARGRDSTIMRGATSMISCTYGAFGV
ncbi:hypothetical protein LTR64_000955 [Lithohypha guttulata]|uniref:uncharacterized protein n=1 Tax=Lithohypha guttulata TaxID=1690604 RepID=UPI002DDDFFBF|nr:hypothetical protein LTR51_003149 [Lithohypha guttulata]